MQFNLTGQTTITSNLLHQFLDTTLTVRDQNSNISALLATRVPSLDDGSWVVNDDGTMLVTWHLRRGWLWQEGKELTSDDVRFSWEVDTAVPFQAGILTRQIDRIDTPDPYTVAMHWKNTSQNGNELGYREFDILPRHVLGEAFQADKDSIGNNPYLVDPSAFVGAGPFQPTEWDRGSQLTAVAFDKYFLGRPQARPRHVQGHHHAGNNVGGYNNPAVDRAILSLRSSLRLDDQYGAFAEAWRQISVDVAVIPAYYVPIPFTGRKGITGWQPTSPQGETAYAPYLWDVS